MCFLDFLNALYKNLSKVVYKEENLLEKKIEKITSE